MIVSLQDLIGFVELKLPCWKSAYRAPAWTLHRFAPEPLFGGLITLVVRSHRPV